MDVSLDNIFDLPRLASCRFKVDIYIALGIDNGCDAFRPNHVRCVGQATQIELFHLYRFHAFFSCTTLLSIAAAPLAADRAGLASSPPDISALPVRRTRKAQ